MMGLEENMVELSDLAVLRDDTGQALIDVLRKHSKQAWRWELKNHLTWWPCQPTVETHSLWGLLWPFL